MINLKDAWNETYQRALDEGHSEEEAESIADEAQDDYIEWKLDEAKEERMWRGA
jgi:hypothetical protein